MHSPWQEVYPFFRVPSLLVSGGLPHGIWLIPISWGNGYGSLLLILILLFLLLNSIVDNWLSSRYPQDKEEYQQTACESWN